MSLFDTSLFDSFAFDEAEAAAVVTPATPSNGFLRFGTPIAVISGSAIILVASMSQSVPSNISDLIILTPGATQYDPKPGWTSLGATKTGVQINRSNEEEAVMDQFTGDVDVVPINWQMTVATALAEMTPEMISLAWEGGAATTDTAPNPDEKHAPFGDARDYVERRLAVLYQSRTGKIRAHVFRCVQKLPDEQTSMYQPRGEQQNVPTRFRCLPDEAVADPNARFGETIVQVGP